VSMVTVSAVEETYLGVLIVTGSWAIFSGARVVATAQARQRSASWLWASSFLAASLVAAYCCGRLL
jgi:hypothetical protein